MREEHAAVMQILDKADTSHTGWGRDNCPFCLTRIGKEDRRRSFSVNAESGYFHCFRCGVKGRLRGERFEDVRFAAQKKVQQTMEKPEGYTLLHEEPGLSASVLEPARQYLKNRGFGSRTWELAEIGACYRGMWAERIIVPILARNGFTWKGFVARDYSGNSMRKYMYPEGMNRNALLFQHHVLHDDCDDPVLIVEGVFDALPYLGQAVACLGKPTKGQFELFCASTRPLVVVLDGDAWEEGYALSQKLKLNGKRSGYVKLAPGDDPGSVDVGWLLTEVQRSIS